LIGPRLRSNDEGVEWPFAAGPRLEPSRLRQRQGGDDELGALTDGHKRNARSVLHFRGTKAGVMPAKAGIHLSAATLYDTGFPLSRE